MQYHNKLTYVLDNIDMFRDLYEDSNKRLTFAPFCMNWFDEKQQAAEFERLYEIFSNSQG